jgi:ubiquinone/menaquinone biosynthesis C-methylase UbiE
MDKIFEQRYLKLQSNWWFSARRELILNLIKDIPYNNVLEIGCGSGELSKYIDNYIGIDTSKTAKSIIGDAQRLPIKDNFADLILILDILEHTDDKIVIDEVYRVLKPSGNVIVTVPGFMFLWSQHDIDNHHVKRYKNGELPLKQFKIEKFTYWNFLMFPIIILVKKKKTQLTTLPKSVNYILQKILKIENYLISIGIRFPIGITLVYKLKTKK